MGRTLKNDRQESLFSSDWPATGWAPPKDFPRLEAASLISIDCETCDPLLTERGDPGFFRGDAYVAGLAVGTDDGGRWYFPVRHERGANLPAEAVFAWAKDELGRESQPKVGANLPYDVEALWAEGVDVRGPLWDVQVAEPLLDENADGYSLEALANRYLGEGKVDEVLNEWCAAAFGGPATRKGQAKNYWRAPAELVGPYAEGDVDLPLRILQKQLAQLKELELMDLFALECRLLPMLIAMRRRGVRVDLDRVDRVEIEMRASVEEAIQRAGVDVWSAESIARAADRLGLTYPRTPKGAPSFVKDWLEAQDHELFAAVAAARKLDKAKGTFIDGHIRGNLVGDRLHVQFHSLRTDDWGTVSGRLSSTHHNIPKRDKVIGPMMRGLFLPDEGQRWVKHDYSQVEPRIQFHYARGPQADARRLALQANPGANCYREMMRDMGGVTIDYTQFKSVWLGISYGMGDAKMAAQLGVTKERAKEFRAAFPPYILELAERCSKAAANRGHIRTLLGRYARFPLWESRDWGEARADGAMPEGIARAKYNGRIRRAHTHKGLNRLAQGSAADVMKKAMVDVWESGVCDVLSAPLLTVHDELDWSVPQEAFAGTKIGDEAIAEAKRIMETCVKLRVPLRVEETAGVNWGECE